MDKYYSVSEFAKLTGKDPGNIRKLLIAGKIHGEKIGNQWIIPEGTEYPNDKRIKNNKYIDWRRINTLRSSHPELMKALNKMCKELGNVYGKSLDCVVMYGSYARGDENKESDVDIAIILKDEDNESKHDAMTDIVVDYELEQGVTLSVVSIAYKEYMTWKNVLPFYKNLCKEGIILWKAA